MNCEAFISTFFQVVSGDPPPDFSPERQREHFLSCDRCRFLLTTDEMAERIAETVQSRPVTEEDRVQFRKILRAIRKKEAHRRLLRSGFGAVLLVLVAGVAMSFGPRARLRERIRTARRASPASVNPREVGARLASPAFHFLRDVETPRHHTTVLVYDRTDYRADQYEFAKRILLAAVRRHLFGSAIFVVSIGDHRKCILQVMMRRKQLRKLRIELLLPLRGPRFCAQFKVLYDRFGLSH